MYRSVRKKCSHLGVRARCEQGVRAGCEHRKRHATPLFFPGEIQGDAQAFFGVEAPDSRRTAVGRAEVRGGGRRFRRLPLPRRNAAHSGVSHGSGRLGA